MSKKTIKKDKNTIPTMVFKSDKSKDYFYKLKDGSYLEIKSNINPFINELNITNQLTLF
jgi:hypothetical protein